MEDCAPSLPAVLPRPAGCRGVCPSARRVVTGGGSMPGSQSGRLRVRQCMVNRGTLHMPRPQHGTGPLPPGCLRPKAGPGQPAVTPAVTTPTADHERLQCAPHHRAGRLRRGVRVPEGRHGQDVSAGSEPGSSGTPAGREGPWGCPRGSLRRLLSLSIPGVLLLAAQAPGAPSLRHFLLPSLCLDSDGS